MIEKKISNLMRDKVRGLDSSERDCIDEMRSEKGREKDRSLADKNRSQDVLSLRDTNINEKKENATKVASKVIHYSPREYINYKNNNYINFSVYGIDAEGCLSRINGNAAISKIVSRPETSGFDSQLRRICNLYFKNFIDVINDGARGINSESSHSSLSDTNIKKELNILIN